MTRRVSSIVIFFAAGCGTQPTFLLPDAAVPSPTSSEHRFDRSGCGTITGRVTWAGALPETPTFLYGVAADGGNFVTKTLSGPYQPRIDPKSHGLSGVVVSLRGVDPAASRPWDHPPVRVEIAGGSIRVIQGGVGRVGFVRRFAEVPFASGEPVYHILRGRGDDFFSLALPAADSPRVRKFERPGRVELSSGTGLYWARADLFVADHPYWALTDDAGRFSLPQVPAGRVEVVAWHPNWRPARQDRDPETGLVSRMTYAPPLERTTPVEVTAGMTCDVALSFE
ncbi:MAG: carboxypeptidase-like regulatory domain-containing protein [Gemmataceae bacterium]